MWINSTTFETSYLKKESKKPPSKSGEYGRRSFAIILFRVLEFKSMIKISCDVFIFNMEGIGVFSLKNIVDYMVREKAKLHLCITPTIALEISLPVTKKGVIPVLACQP
jgi:hypothetical protein